MMRLAQAVTERADGKRNLSFDVVSIRQNISGQGLALTYEPDGFTVTDIPIQAVMVNAYRLRDPELMMGGKLLPGAPGWVESDRYDIRGKMSSSL
jgi:uncharacterized protein (TIGR03435 family)